VDAHPLLGTLNLKYQEGIPENGHPSQYWLDVDAPMEQRYITISHILATDRGFIRSVNLTLSLNYFSLDRSLLPLYRNENFGIATSAAINQHVQQLHRRFLHLTGGFLCLQI